MVTRFAIGDIGVDVVLKDIRNIRRVFTLLQAGCVFRRLRI